MVAAFLFDLDGTLLDSEILWVESIQQVLTGKGFSISRSEALNLVYGRSWSEIRRNIQESYPETFADKEYLEKLTRRAFKKLRATRDIRIPSSIDLLVRLARDYPVAIVSGSTRLTVEESIELMGIKPYVRLFVGTEDCADGKPAPDCFLLAAGKLGVPPEACIVFEDSTAGIRAAKAANMTCIALSRPGRPAQDVSLADEVLTDLSDFSPEKYGIK